MSNDDSEVLWSLLWITLLSAGCFVGGCCVGDKGRKDAAIEANVAEYRVDAKTGKVSFEWKNHGEESK